MTVTAITASVLFLLQVAKGSIEGSVFSSATNKPIPGAQVSATGLPNAPTIPPGGGVVTGRVVGVVAGGVVGGVIGATGARVVESPAQLQVVAPTQIQPAAADKDGHFVFQDLEAGTYLLRAAADGYAQQEFNVRPGAQGGKTTQVNLA